MLSHIKQPGQVGFNPNHLNVIPPNHKYKFPTLKGTEMTSFSKVKEFVDPTDIPVLSQQDLQVRTSQPALVTVDYQLEKIASIASLLASSYIGNSVKFPSNDKNHERLTNYLISSSYLALANKLFVSCYKRCSDIEELSIVTNFKPILPKSLQSLIDQVGDAKTNKGKVDVLYVKSAIQECIIRAASWLPVISEEIPDVFENPFKLNNQQVNQTSVIIARAQSGPLRKDRYLIEYDDTHYDNNTKDFFDRCRTLFSSERRDQGLSTNVFFLWNSEERIEQFQIKLTEVVKQVEEQNHAFQALIPNEAYDTWLLNQIGNNNAHAHDDAAAYQVPIFISHSYETSRLRLQQDANIQRIITFQDADLNVNQNGVTLQVYAHNIQMTQNILEQFIESFSMFYAQKIAPFFECHYQCSEFHPSSYGTMAQLVKDKVTPFSITNSEALNGYVLNIANQVSKPCHYVGISPYTQDKIAQIFMKMDKQIGEYG